jgi:hypothetical protein
MKGFVNPAAVSRSSGFVSKRAFSVTKGAWPLPLRKFLPEIGGVPPGIQPQHSAESRACLQQWMELELCWRRMSPGHGRTRKDINPQAHSWPPVSRMPQARGRPVEVCLGTRWEHTRQDPPRPAHTVSRLASTGLHKSLAGPIFIESASLPQISSLVASSPELCRAPATIVVLLGRIAALLPPPPHSPKQLLRSDSISSDGAMDRDAGLIIKALLAQTESCLGSLEPQLLADLLSSAGDLAHLPGVRHSLLRAGVQGGASIGSKMLLLLASKAQHLPPASVARVLCSLGRLRAGKEGLAALEHGVGERALQVIERWDVSMLMHALRGLVQLYVDTRAAARMGASGAGARGSDVELHSPVLVARSGRKQRRRADGAARMNRHMLWEVLRRVLATCRGKLGQVSLDDLLYLVESLAPLRRLSIMEGEPRVSWSQLIQGARQPLVVAVQAVLLAHHQVGGHAGLAASGPAGKGGAAGELHAHSQMVRATCAMAACGVTPSRELAEGLCRHVSQHLPLFTTMELVRFVWSASKIRMEVDGALEAALLHELEARAADFNAIDLSNALVGLARFSSCGDNAEGVDRFPSRSPPARDGGEGAGGAGREGAGAAGGEGSRRRWDVMSEGFLGAMKAMERRLVEGCAYLLNGQGTANVVWALSQIYGQMRSVEAARGGGRGGGEGRGRRAREEVEGQRHWRVQALHKLLERARVTGAQMSPPGLAMALSELPVLCNHVSRMSWRLDARAAEVRGADGGAETEAAVELERLREAHGAAMRTLKESACRVAQNFDAHAVATTLGMLAQQAQDAQHQPGSLQASVPPLASAGVAGGGVFGAEQEWAPEDRFGERGEDAWEGASDVWAGDEDCEETGGGTRLQAKDEMLKVAMVNQAVRLLKHDTQNMNTQVWGSGLRVEG